MPATKPISDPQRRLLEKLPVSGEWVDVPFPARAGTILALVRRGVIEHRYNEPHHFMDWVTWGQVRRKL